MIIMSCIGIITGGLSAELSLALAGAGIAMTIYDAKISIDGVSYANKLKEQAQTTHEAKDAAKIMADNIAKLTIDVINVICTVAGYLKGKKKIENKNLIKELKERNIKFNENEIIKIMKTDDGKIVFLEKGNERAGFKHILNHEQDFLNKGIPKENIVDIIFYAIKNGKIIGTQGRGRPIYECNYNGTIQKIAITVSNNGFIVGANPN